MAYNLSFHGILRVHSSIIVVNLRFRAWNMVGLRVRVWISVSFVIIYLLGVSFSGQLVYHFAVFRYLFETPSLFEHARGTFDFRIASLYVRIRVSIKNKGLSLSFIIIVWQRSWFKIDLVQLKVRVPPTIMIKAARNLRRYTTTAVQNTRRLANQELGL